MHHTSWEDQPGALSGVFFIQPQVEKGGLCRAWLEMGFKRRAPGAAQGEVGTQPSCPRPGSRQGSQQSTQL